MESDDDVGGGDEETNAFSYFNAVAGLALDNAALAQPNKDNGIGKNNLLPQPVPLSSIQPVDWIESVGLHTIMSDK